MRAPSGPDVVAGEVLLAVENVSLAFGGVKAISGVSFDIRKGEIRAIIGPNGAGKTSLLNVINGFYHPQHGRITFKGRPRSAMRPYEAALGGIARTFQNVALFKGMTALDNIMAGRTLKMRRGFFWQLIRIGPALAEEVEQRRRAEEIIDFLKIQHVRKIQVGKLPYGLQKRVELGRALAMEPDLLLLDEPMAGMNLEEKEDMCRFILDVNAHYGTTIALIEHDMGVVMDLSERVLVLAFALSVLIMIALAYAIEFLVLRHLVNQEGIILFMATLGIAYFLEGFGQSIWGSDIYKIGLGLPTNPIFILESVFPGGLLIDPTELIAATICAVMVLVLAVFFQVTRVGRALRAVADDHQAAQSVGIPLNQIWLMVWAVSGLVALVAGMMWGAKLGVQFSLSLIALKALPVLILGGLTSIPGAIVGGLIIGAGEKLAEVVLGPVLIRTFDLADGGIENWFAYVLALIFLLFRPQGLFGERIIERV